MCGILGIYYNNSTDILSLLLPGLLSLQHRGQESAGISISDGKEIYKKHIMGLTSQLSSELQYDNIKGNIGIGHVRYSTKGNSSLTNCQPYVFNIEQQQETTSPHISWLGWMAMAQNGTITRYENENDISSDCHYIAQFLQETKENNIQDKIINFIKEFDAAYSIILMTLDKLYCWKDRYGFRPLFIGKDSKENYYVSSETCAFSTLNVKCIHSVHPGEIIEISKEGMKSIYTYSKPQPTFCAFEYVYFSRPDSYIDNNQVHSVRTELGKQLARECPIDADYVMGVPDSATPHAIGYSHESGIPFYECLTKNRYIGRTFICPTQEERKNKIKMKFNILKQNIKNKSIILIDDSIVRGNTIKHIIEYLKKSGVLKIHLRIACPPIKHPCHMGINMSTYDELIASKHNVNEIKDIIGADSLYYISLEGMNKVIPNKNTCTACWSGIYHNKIEW